MSGVHSGTTVLEQDDAQVVFGIPAPLSPPTPWPVITTSTPISHSQYRAIKKVMKLAVSAYFKKEEYIKNDIQ